MRIRLARHSARYQFIAVALLLAGCASKPAVVAVKTPIAPAPAACKVKPKAAPRLPDREMPVAELATAYNRLKAQYRRETGRYEVCQGYVSRL